VRRKLLLEEPFEAIGSALGGFFSLLDLLPVSWSTPHVYTHKSRSEVSTQVLFANCCERSRRSCRHRAPGAIA
jgi:hypothetical protein